MDDRGSITTNSHRVISEQGNGEKEKSVEEAKDRDFNILLIA